MAQDLGNKNNWDLLVMGIQTGGFKARLFGYFIFYVIFAIVLMLLVLIAQPKMPAGTFTKFDIILQHLFFWGGSGSSFLLLGEKH